MDNQKRKLHIVTFGNPYPPNYGGAIDVFYKVQALSRKKISIHLHYFDDEIGDTSKLQEFCEEIYFYKKRRNFIYLLSKLPYATIIRRSKKLQSNIAKVNAPVLLEGFQSCSYLLGNNINSENCFVRIHNNEEKYYLGLASSESNIFKKLLYRSQAKKMKRFERKLDGIKAAISLSFHEQEYFSRTLKSQVCFIPVFHQNNEVKKLSKKGDYALYHGDLSTSDNYRTAKFFIDVFKDIPYPLIIAGSHRLEILKKMSSDNDNISIVKIKNEEHLEALFSKAHINVLASFQRSGTKLKVINALYKSRFCLINENVVDDPRIMKLCTIASTKASFRKEIKRLIKLDYDPHHRFDVLDQTYNILKSAQDLIDIIYSNDIQ